MKNKEACKRNRIELSIRSAFNIPKEADELINSLVNNIVWIIIKLDECRANIDSEGISVDFCQGEQFMVIQSPYVKTYNDLIKNYNVTIKNLLTLCPKIERKSLTPEQEAFMNFAKGAKRPSDLKSM